MRLRAPVSIHRGNRVRPERQRACLRTSTLAIVAAPLLLAVAHVSPAAAEPTQATVAAETVPIYTAGETGAYHTEFCPPLVAALKQSGSTATCTPTLGTTDNLARIRDEPLAFAFAQLDILALERDAHGGSEAITIARLDDARECIYAVARNENLKSFGDLAARASRLRFILPPKPSGSAGTFRVLQSLDRDLAGAGEVRHAASTEDAIRLALSADDTVAIFVQFPDPGNARFKLVGELGGHFVPVIDRAVLQHRVDGQLVYFAQDTEVADPRWLKSGTSLVTACTPIALITGPEQRLTDAQARARHAALVRAVQALPSDKLRPQDGLLSLVLKRTKALSATAVEQLVALSEKAREKTAPLIERAQEATSKALEGAKPHVEKAKEAGAETLERAKETVKELIAPEKPSDHTPGGAN